MSNAYKYPFQVIVKIYKENMKVKKTNTHKHTQLIFKQKLGRKHDNAMTLNNCFLSPGPNRFVLT